MTIRDFLRFHQNKVPIMRVDGWLNVSIQFYKPKPKGSNCFLFYMADNQAEAIE